jgi:hypothetical protein
MFNGFCDAAFFRQNPAGENVLAAKPYSRAPPLTKSFLTISVAQNSSPASHRIRFSMVRQAHHEVALADSARPSP